MKKILLSPWTSLITLALVLTVRIIDPTFVESVRLRYFDTLITSKAPTKNEIYTVNIDDAALDKFGQFPFPRQTYSDIINSLYSRHAGLVVSTILSADTDRFGGDKLYSETLKEYPVVLPNVPSQKSKNTPRHPGSAILGPEHLDRIVQYKGLIANIPEIELAAAGIGTVNTLPEIDGVNRRVPLVSSIDGKLYPSIAMETLRVLAGDSTFQVKLNDNGVEKMRIPTFGPIATDSLGRIWIDWSQENKKVSLASLPDGFGGALVILGTSATGISNPVPTAKGAVWPQDVQAAIIGTMMNNVVINRPDYADGLELISIVLACLILLFLTRWTYVGIASIFVFVIGAAYGSYFAYNHYLWLFDATAPVCAIILVSLHAYGIKFISEFLQKQQIKKQFGTYLSPAMVEKLQKNPELLKLGGESRELSIMFTDVRGFTSISEHYGKDVQGLTKIMNRYMTAMTEKIIENNGTLDKYIGDAQMAFWNAPLNDVEHAKNAVKTAVAMLKDLEKFNDEISKENIPPFGLGIGINTDTVVVGNMGSTQRFDYTCLGDGVNLASRLEGQSKPYGVKLILGPKTAEYVSFDYMLLELDSIAVKGKIEPVKIYTIAPHYNHMAQRQHGKFLDAYRKGVWKAAKFYSVDLKGKCWNGEMNKYYDMMLERMEGEVPENWDGVFRATSK